MALASGLLQGAALQWFYNFQLGRRGADVSHIKTEPGMMETDSVPPLSWSEFLRELRFAFQPADYQALLREQLRQLQQKGDILEYVTEFRNLDGQILNSSNEDRIDRFLSGLKPRTRAEVRYQQVPTLEEAISTATTFENASFGSVRNANPYHHQQRTRVYAPRVNAIATARHKSNPRKSHQRAQGLCFECNKPGHVARDCPTKRSGNENGRQ